MIKNQLSINERRFDRRSIRVDACGKSHAEYQGVKQKNERAPNPGGDFLHLFVSLIEQD